VTDDLQRGIACTTFTLRAKAAKSFLHAGFELGVVSVAIQNVLWAGHKSGGPQCWCVDVGIQLYGAGRPFACQRISLASAQCTARNRPTGQRAFVRRLRRHLWDSAPDHGHGTCPPIRPHRLRCVLAFGVVGVLPPIGPVFPSRPAPDACQSYQQW